MATYCQAGDTARVTFPDGSSQDFTDTSIRVEIGKECTDYYAVSYRVFALLENGENISPLFTGNYRYPFGGFRVNPVSPSQWQYSGRGTYPWQDCGDYPYGWYTIGTITGSVITSISIISQELVILSNAAPFLLRVLNPQGNVLFSGYFNARHYSVDCIQGCPPNTLDCGDCCLPCDEIFNSISDIRRLISRIR